MGSIFTTEDQPGWVRRVPFYMQFVPGIVLDVCLNSQSPTYIEPRDINSIIASDLQDSSKVFINGKWVGIHRLPDFL